MERLAVRLRFPSMIAVLAALIAAGVGDVALPAATPPYLPVHAGDAVIMLTASTNASGYRIVVGHAGSAQFVDGSGTGAGAIPAALAATLFADLAAAAPLDRLPRAACMKSASFGTSLFVYWDHKRSPDLTCAASARGRALAQDVQSVASALHVAARLRGVMHPLLPGEMHHPLPTPLPSGSS
jgi:hypothetical protein